MKKISKVVAALALTCVWTFVAISCSNNSGGGSSGSGNEGGGSTAITGSSVFIAGRSLTLPNITACDHEVTQGEYETYCKYGGTAPSADKGLGNNYPAYYVNWYDAIVYCNLRSKAEGLTPCYKLGGSDNTTSWAGIVSEGGKYCGPSNNNDSWNEITCDWTATGWRLPTEAEWEMLARGGNLTNENQTTYSGSNTIDDVAWYKDNSGNKTHEVKSKTKANALGLYDMTGNVCEWCWDWYSNISASTPAFGPEFGDSRIIRGGSWPLDADYCSNAYRDCGGEPEGRGVWANIGFRVVRNAN